MPKFRESRGHGVNFYTNYKNFKNQKKKLLLFSTGGTIEKIYDENSGSLENRETVIKEKIIDRMRYPYLDFQIKAVMAKDSLHITDHDRKIIYQVIKDHESEDASMVILHGTDTVDQTLQYCYEQEQQAKKKISVPVVFTGSMTPLGFVDSDAFQNVVEAIQASQLLEPGFYLSFHGQVFIPPMLQKNREKRTFEKKL
ncbi:MAG: asparaginase [Halobacteriovoraceae bacterium]|nr:asparaginase [Halobacteriovoraceae bacterium]MCB9095596.1 asparaginase [Halobacteriovoraceae bacterium]